MEFSDIIKNLRKQKKLTQKKLATLLNVDFTTIGKWEQIGTIPNQKILFKLCDIFNVSVDYLLGRTIDKNVTPIEFDRDVTKIAVLGTIPAGVPIEMCEDIIDYEEIPTEWLKSGHKFFGLKINGESMSPNFLSNDIIMVRQQSSCENGQYCVVSINCTECTFKKVIIKDDGILLQPLNPSFEPMSFTKKQVEELPITILGVVVEVRRTL